LSIVHIEPKTRGILPPRHLRRYLLMSKYTRLKGMGWKCQLIL